MEILHLQPEAGPEIIELIQANKTLISEMADLEKKQFQDAMKQLWEYVMDFSHKQELSEIDFQTRSFEWQQLDVSRWSCRHHPAEGRICLVKDKIFWHACVKRDGYAGKFDYFVKLLEAVEWVEKELVDLASQPEIPAGPPRMHSDQQIVDDHTRLRKKLADGPYWINPSTLEPSQITYKFFIELEAKPIDFKTYESICGDKHRYDERYLYAPKMASALNLDIDHFNVDQPLGDNSDWYRFTSLTKYYQELPAVEQAQRAWDQSRIQQQFKEGKISRARYGYKEVETGFTVYLGACEEPEKPWEQPGTRKDYMELQALRESLSFALDITDFRDFLGFSTEFFSDEQVLQSMHRVRARSKNLPEEIRRESKVWLAQHEPIE